MTKILPEGYLLKSLGTLAEHLQTQSRFERVSVYVTLTDGDSASAHAHEGHTCIIVPDDRLIPYIWEPAPIRGLLINKPLDLGDIANGCAEFFAQSPDAPAPCEAWRLDNLVQMVGRMLTLVIAGEHKMRQRKAAA